MMRGSINEDAVMASLTKCPFVIATFSVGMLAAKDFNWLACSPDGLAQIKVPLDGTSNQIEAQSTAGEDQPELHEIILLATVEIKTSVAESSVQLITSNATATAVHCTVGDENFRKYIPEGHIDQLLHQLLVTGLRHGIYVAATETSIQYTVIAFCPEDIIIACKRALVSTATDVLAWTHASEP